MMYNFVCSSIQIQSRKVSELETKVRKGKVRWANRCPLSRFWKQIRVFAYSFNKLNKHWPSSKVIHAFPPSIVISTTHSPIHWTLNKRCTIHNFNKTNVFLWSILNSHLMTIQSDMTVIRSGQWQTQLSPKIILAFANLPEHEFYKTLTGWTVNSLPQNKGNPGKQDRLFQKQKKFFFCLINASRKFLIRILRYAEKRILASFGTNEEKRSLCELFLIKTF